MGKQSKPKTKTGIFNLTGMGNNVTFPMPLTSSNTGLNRANITTCLHSIRVRLFTQFPIQVDFLLVVPKYLSSPAFGPYIVRITADSTSQYSCRSKFLGLSQILSMLG